MESKALLNFSKDFVKSFAEKTGGIPCIKQFSRISNLKTEIW